MKILKVIAVLLLIMTMICLVGCSNGEKEIKGQITSVMDGILADSAIVADKTDFSCLNAVGISTESFLTKYFEGTEYTVEVAEIGDQQETTATVLITARDYSEFVKNLNSEADEMVAKDDFLDLFKEQRYAQAVNDTTNAIVATDLSKITVKINFINDGEAWKAKEDVTETIIESLFPKEAVSKTESVIARYMWKYDDVDSEKVISEMKKVGLPIGDIQTFDESTDPNDLLGRPNQYTQKTTFFDTRIEDPYGISINEDGTFNNDFGGTIEVFNTIEDRNARENHLTSLKDIYSFAGQYYMYCRANMILRISFDLLPSEAEEYAREFFQTEVNGYVMK